MALNKKLLAGAIAGLLFSTNASAIVLTAAMVHIARDTSGTSGSTTVEVSSIEMGTVAKKFPAMGLLNSLVTAAG